MMVYFEMFILSLGFLIIGFWIGLFTGRDVLK